MDHKRERIEILLEEPSMEAFLKETLPSMLPEGYELDTNVFMRPHNGKSDLMKSISKKVKAFSNFYLPAKIIIVHDQDSNDCKELKQSIIDRCQEAGDCPVLVRIACHELENWYLGNMYAIEQTYPRFKAAQHENKAKYRDPDRCHGADEMRKLVPNFQKGQGAKDISKHIELSKNKSKSLGHVASGIKSFLTK